MSSPQFELSAAVADELKQATKNGHIVLTRRGQPVAYLFPTDIYDDEDIGYMTDPEFWKMVQKWRSDDQPLVPFEQVLAEMNVSTGAESTTTTPPPLKKQVG